MERSPYLWGTLARPDFAPRTAQRHLFAADSSTAHVDAVWAHAVRGEGLADRAEAEDDFAQAQDELLKMMSTPAIVIGEELNPAARGWCDFQRRRLIDLMTKPGSLHGLRALWLGGQMGRMSGCGDGMYPPLGCSISIPSRSMCPISSSTDIPHSSAASAIETGSSSTVSPLARGKVVGLRCPAVVCRKERRWP